MLVIHRLVQADEVCVQAQAFWDRFLFENDERCLHLLFRIHRRVDDRFVDIRRPVPDFFQADDVQDARGEILVHEFEVVDPHRVRFRVPLRRVLADRVLELRVRHQLFDRRDLVSFQDRRMCIR